jgi:hypothetical protein
MNYWHFPCGEGKNILENSAKLYMVLEFGASPRLNPCFLLVQVQNSCFLFVHSTGKLFGEPLAIS